MLEARNTVRSLLSARRGGAIWAVVSIIVALGALPAESDEIGEAGFAAALKSAVAAADLDLDHCSSSQDGKSVATDPAAVLFSLGLGGAPQNQWKAGAVEGQSAQGETFGYLIAFKKSVKIGSLFCEKRGDWTVIDRVVYTLKAQAPYPPDPADKSQWEVVNFPPLQSGRRLATFSPNFATRAILTIETRRQGESQAGTFRLYAHRLYDLLPSGSATAPTEYTAHSALAPAYSYGADHVVTGESAWQSSGPQDGVVRGPAITPGNPSWFVVQWETPQTIQGLWVEDNFVKVHFRAYIGPDAINPVIGNDDEWGRIKYDEQSPQPGGPHQRYIEFTKPVVTRAIKVDILETPQNEIQIARINGMHVLADLGEQPAPAMHIVEEPPPFKIHYDLPQEGMTTVAIDGPDGRRVRNLFAREQRHKGPNEENWDLKDESGRAVVPGKYTLRILCNPGIHLSYEMTPYPNIGVNSPENSPWLNGESGSGGWLADHTPPTSICSSGDRLYIGAPTCESGVALIECDLTGRKFWGHGNFLAWTGPHYLAADESYCYAGIAPNYPEHGDTVFRIRSKDKQVDRPIDLPGSGRRKRGLVGLAAREGLLYLAINSHEDFFANAADAEDVDLDHCFPSYARIDRSSHNTQATWIPDRRGEFPALFRMGDMVPGHRGLIAIESQKVAASRQHVVLAFKSEVPVGTLVFPMPNQPMRISLLKAGFVGPPDASDESQWDTIWQSPKKGGWLVLPAPKQAHTRALRLTFARVFDEIEDVLSADNDNPKEKDPIDLLNKGTTDDKQNAWAGSVDGMKILRRRFQSVSANTHITVSSGKIDDAGVWNAQRTEPLSEQNPAVYTMSWDHPQNIRGLAIKEIDGRLTEIDSWDGPASGEIDPASDKHWKKIATYEQKRRKHGAVEAALGPNNSSARYIDGYVDFGQEIATRAIRLRVIAQWANTGVGNETSMGMRDDLGGMDLNASRCRIYGVAPLQMVGDEIPVDPLIGQRIEVWDTTAAAAAQDRPGQSPIPAVPAKFVKEIPFPQGGQIALGPDGNLYGISANQVVAIDVLSGSLRPLISDLSLPQAIAVDGAKYIYVLDNAPDRKVIRVYDPAGKYLKQIGTPGGHVAGPWDPGRIDSATAITVDKKGQLWHTESSYWPKRVVCWDTATGEVKKEFLGNTQYGGGGVLDPQDKSRLYYGPLEFELDWKTGKTRLNNLTWRGSTTAGEIPAYVNERQYMLTHANGATQPDGGAATVYLYQKGICRPVAAMGPARGYVPLQDPAFQVAFAKKFPGKTLGDMRFLWSDTSGDGQIQIDEVQFTPFKGDFRACYFDTHDLSLSTTQQIRYEVNHFLASGVPVYEEKSYPQLPAQPNLRLSSGNYVCMMESDDQIWRIAIMTPQGKELWAYRNEGFSGFAYPHATPWAPSKVVAEFDIIGTGKSRGGDLGEFFVTNDNVGQWNVYSADAMLAGWIFLEIRNPQRKAWSMPEHQRGLALDEVTAGQEHFQGYFCQTADGKYYVVAGHNHASVVEVTGLDQFKRTEKSFDVTAADEQGLQRYDHDLYKKLAYRNVKVMDIYPRAKPFAMDGTAGDWRDQPGGAQLTGVNFNAAFDDRYLYVLYDVHGHGPLKNAGNDWHSLFRTGACVDLEIGADPLANPARPDPVRGDMRLLISIQGGKPVAVLYQPIAPGAPESDKKEFHTEVQSAVFDRVVRLDDAIIAQQTSGDGYSLEAAIPLESIGLKPGDGMRIKFDWGILQSGADGNEVLDHLWWSNKIPLQYDEAAEAKLHPDLWGYARFTTRSQDDLTGPRHATGTQILGGGDENPVKKKPDDIEDELEKGNVK